MSESLAHATELTSQYSAQVAGDLERNAKEQERIGGEIQALQEQLHALQHDHTVLVSMQQALGGGNAQTDTTTAAPSLPQQASAEPQQTKPKKAVATSAKKTAAKKPPTKTSPAKPSPAKAPTVGTTPTLVNLIRDHLQQHSEPRSAGEISSALTQAHPDRSIKTTVVRTTLEGLVAKSHAHRTKQGSSVYYTAAGSSQPATAEPQPQEVAG